MTEVRIGTLDPGTFFEYKTTMDGKPYDAIGKVMAQQPDKSATMYEDEYGHPQRVAASFYVNPAA